MSNMLSPSIPKDQLRSLDFLLGEGSGFETMYPPGRPPVQFNASYVAAREDCERFVKVDFFCEIPGIGIESFMALLTWSSLKDCYRMWIFSTANEEPMHMTGNFQGEKLIMISDPWNMPWGLQKMRSTFVPHDENGFSYLSELWELDGYSKYCSVSFELST